MNERPSESGPLPEGWDPEEYERAQQERLARRQQQRKRPRRKGPGGVPPIFLLAGLLVLLLVALFVVFSSCGEEENPSAQDQTDSSLPDAAETDSTAAEDQMPGDTTDESPDATDGAAGEGTDGADGSPDGSVIQAEGGNVSAEVGEPVMLGSVRVNVTSLSTTERPTTPHRPATEAATVPDSGTFVQAFVYVQNRSSDAVRIEPLDFMLVAGGRGADPIPGLTGPPARTLLPSASLDLIVTFPAPEEEISGLVYSPGWFPGRLSVSGEVAPAGMSTPGDAESPDGANGADGADGDGE